MSFEDDRPVQPRHARLTVSIPPTHTLGSIEWHDSPVPDTARHFAVTDIERFPDADEMTQAIAAKDGDTIFLFVHGYNMTTSEAVYRFAQMAHDFELPQARVAFSWASAGLPPAYVYDRDSVLFARDAFVSLLIDLAEDTDRDINLMAHSMGSVLVMESLRQLRLMGRDDVIDRIDIVTLMSPDIDPDLFRAQARVIGELPQPFVILSSQTDRALRLSSVLAGGRERVGAISSAEDVDGLGITYIDFTNLADGRNMDHMVPVTSPDAIRLLRQMANPETVNQTDFGAFLVADADGLSFAR